MIILHPTKCLERIFKYSYLVSIILNSQFPKTIFADFFVLILDFNSISSHFNSINLNSTEMLHRLYCRYRGVQININIYIFLYTMYCSLSFGHLRRNNMLALRVMWPWSLLAHTAQVQISPPNLINCWYY